MFYVLASLLDNYFKGAGYGSGGADNFALNAPAALFRLDNNYNLPHQYQGITGAHADAQPTSVTIFSVYHRHLSQRHPPLICCYVSILSSKPLSVCNLCLKQMLPPFL